MPEGQRAVVSVLLINARGEVLLQLRDDKPGLPYANTWTLFGGSVEPGETPTAAIHRELHEELALELPLTFWREYICPVRSQPGVVRVLNHVFTGELDRDLSTLTLYEGQSMAYFSAESAAGMPLAFAQETILHDFFAERRA